MNINIKATKVTLTPAIKNFIYDKLASVSKFLKTEDKIYIELEVDKKHRSGQIHRVEIRISPHGYYAEAYGNDFYEAADLTIPKIKEQLIKAKDKKISVRRKVRKNLAKLSR